MPEFDQVCPPFKDGQSETGQTGNWSVKRDEITSSPGRLAQKIGISRRTLMRHLEDTGLISQCFRDVNNCWRLPSRIAEKVASANALTIPDPPPQRRPAQSNRGKYSDDYTRTGANTPPRPKTRLEILTQPREDNNLPQSYRQVGEVLRQAGVSCRICFMVINPKESQMMIRRRPISQKKPDGDIRVSLPRRS